MGARRIVNRLGCACASLLVLVGCAREGGRAAANAPADAVNAASLSAAPPNSPSANTSDNDLFAIDTNAADAVNSTNTVDPWEAIVLAQKNADCVDQLIKAQPLGEDRSEVVDNVTKACLPIAKWEAQSSPKRPANVDATERTFVAGRAHALIDGPSS
jgi:hypothetical protein